MEEKQDSNQSLIKNVISVFLLYISYMLSNAIFWGLVYRTLNSLEMARFGFVIYLTSSLINFFELGLLRVLQRAIVYNEQRNPLLIILYFLLVGFLTSFILFIMRKDYCRCSR